MLGPGGSSTAAIGGSSTPTSSSKIGVPSTTSYCTSADRWICDTGCIIGVGAGEKNILMSFSSSLCNSSTL